MRILVLLMASTLAAALVPPADAQSTATPPLFAVGANKAYCHVTDVSNTIWMNTQLNDGDGVPYEIYGDPAATDPVLGAGVDPVADEDFETRIPLSPALTQDIVIAGTVTVQAYIGGGTYTAGTGSIGTSLVAGGAVLGSAAAKEHRMSPSQSGETYIAISWTFDVPSTTVPKGTLLEWVISGSASGNNVFLACHEARGRSSIDLPIASATGGPVSTINHLINGTTAKISLNAAEATNATHVYNWTTNLTSLSLRIAGGVAAGNVSIAIRDGANATVHNATYAGNVSRELTAAAGNWTFTVKLQGFRGNLTIEAGPPLPVSNATSATATPGKGGTGTKTSSVSGSGSDDGGKKDTPALALPVLVALLAVAVLRRRR